MEGISKRIPYPRFLGHGLMFEGALFSGFPGAIVYFEGYLGGNLVGTSSTLDPSSTPTFLAANFDGPVDYVNVVSGSFHFNAMDDVTSQPIPPPGAILLGSIGTGYVSWLRKRRTL